MPTIDRSVELERSREAVFDFITEPANWPLYNHSILEAERLSSDVGVGARSRGVVKVAGRRVDWTNEVIEHHRPDRFAVRSIGTPVDVELRWTLAELGSHRCRLTFHQDAPGLGGLLGRLLDAIVTALYERDVATNHAALKQLIERG